MSSKASQPIQNNRLRRLFLRIVLWVVIALVLNLTFRTVVAQGFRATGGAVAPEVPAGARVWAYKLSSSYNKGDIVIFRRENGRAYLGRVVSVDHAAEEMTVARNGEQDRVVQLDRLVGRVVLTTR